jgi:hypothetical protein
MNCLRRLVLLPLATALALGQSVNQNRQSASANPPEALVRSLYREVVARHPMGLPRGANRNIFAPYLSQSLLHRIDSTDACSRDWTRQNQGRIVKAPFAWAESGLFSGPNELTDPLTFLIEKTETEKDGSFRVYVKFSGGPPENPWAWEVATVVVLENRHFVIDDVVYLKGKELEKEYRLSDVLVKGCDGPHWVGFLDAK